MQSAVCSNCRSRSSYPADDTKNASPLSQWAAYSVCYALLEELDCTADMYHMYGSAVEEEDYELLMLIADEMTSNILHII